MRISEDERRAIRTVLGLGEEWGYGNLIPHLQTGWARRLMRNGLPEESAREASGGRGYPFKMQDDLLELSEWDETGARYRASTPKIKQRRRRKG